MKHKIVQIMPARPGWEAIYLNGSEMSEEERNGAPPQTRSQPIECLALVQYDDGSTSVVAMRKESWDSAHFHLVDDDDSMFVMLNRPDDNPVSPNELEQMTRHARRMFEDLREKYRTNKFVSDEDDIDWQEE